MCVCVTLSLADSWELQLRMSDVVHAPLKHGVVLLAPPPENLTPASYAHILYGLLQQGKVPFKRVMKQEYQPYIWTVVGSAVTSPEYND